MSPFRSDWIITRIEYLVATRGVYITCRRLLPESATTTYNCSASHPEGHVRNSEGVTSIVLPSCIILAPYRHAQSSQCQYPAKVRPHLSSGSISNAILISMLNPAYHQALPPPLQQYFVDRAHGLSSVVPAPIHRAPFQYRGSRVSHA